MNIPTAGSRACECDGLPQVRGLQRIGRRGRESWVRSVRELRQPELDAAAVEPVRELGLEAGEAAEADVRPGLRRAGSLAVGAGIRMVSPAVEREMRSGSGDEAGEVSRRFAVVDTRYRPVVAARCGLARSDQSVWVGLLDPGVGGLDEQRVDARCDGPAARVELRFRNKDEFGSFQIEKKRTGGNPAKAARVTRRQRVREVAQIAGRLGATFGPAPPLAQEGVPQIVSSTSM